MKNLLSIVTVIANDEDVRRFPDLIARLNILPDQRELVAVCHSLSQETQAGLASLIADTPDSTLHFLPQRMSFELAVLIGLDNAIGDRCLVVTATDDFAELWPKFTAALDAGYDVAIVSDANETKASPLLYRSARSIFLRSFGAITGLSIDPSIRQIRLLSRGAVQYLLSRRDAEMLMKSDRLAAGFATQKIIADRVNSTTGRQAPSVGEASQKAYRSLTNSMSLPIRSIVWLGLITAFLNLAYTIYIFAAFLLSDNIAPGWTTQSLQIAIGFFVFSVMFAFFGELLISIDRGINYRLRYFVQREIRSPKSNFSKLQNLHFGSIEAMPAQLAESTNDEL